MPKINRSKTVYHKLPNSLKTGNLPDAKVTVSVGLVIPKGLEDQADKFIKEAHKSIEEAFHTFMKKEIKKYEKDRLTDPDEEDD